MNPQPTAPRRKINRRTPEEIARDGKMRDTCSKQVANAIHHNWDDIRQADGEVTISLIFDGITALTAIKFQKTVTIEHEFVLDDGQSEIPFDEKTQAE